MELISTMVGSVAVVKPIGRFDSRNMNVLSDWLAQAPSMVVVDLSEATFIDSSALGILVRGMKHCRQRDGDLRLCSIQTPIRMIFELTRLDKAFQIFPTDQDAIQAFTKVESQA